MNIINLFAGLLLPGVQDGLDGVIYPTAGRLMGMHPSVIPMADLPLSMVEEVPTMEVLPFTEKEEDRLALLAMMAKEVVEVGDFLEALPKAERMEAHYGWGRDDNLSGGGHAFHHRTTLNCHHAGRQNQGKVRKQRCLVRNLKTAQIW